MTKLAFQAHPKRHKRLAATMFALSIAHASFAMMLMPMPINLESLASVENRGLCLIADCEDFGSSASLPPHEVAQLPLWKTDSRAWARALFWLCNADGYCAKPNDQARPTSAWGELNAPIPAKKNLIVHLPFSQLSAALKDPSPQVRAAALMRIDLGSPGARAAAETLLSDAAWVEPLAHTVADHAYSVLHAAFPEHFSTRGKSALNQERGIKGLADIRMPYAKLAADWSSKIANYPHTTGVNAAPGLAQENVTSFWLDRGALAAFWHLASPQQLEAALAHSDPTIRLTAFDALSIREGRKDLAALAIRAYKLGGATNIGSCISQMQSIGFELFTAILQSGQLDQATLFMDSLDYQTKSRFTLELAGNPVTEIAAYLTKHPSDAAQFAPILRRWALADQPYAVLALAAGGLKADLPRLQSVADAGEFSKLLRRDDAAIYQAARAYYLARRAFVSTQKRSGAADQSISGGVSRDWFQYAYSLADDKAAALFAEIFAAATPKAARIEQLRTLHASLIYSANRKSMNALLWQQHEILLPQHAATILAADPKAAKTAMRLLSGSEWSSQISDLAKLQSADYCYEYASIMTPLMNLLPPKPQETYLLYALDNEPACAIASYLNSTTVKPVTAIQVLSARIARERGKSKALLEAALQTARYQ